MSDNQLDHRWVDVIRRVCPDHSDQDWCQHMSDLVQSGQDADQLDFGIRFQVPLMRTQTPLFATVTISSESIADVCAPMFLVVEDLLVNDESEIPLGLWNKGEGMWSIRAVIVDWVKTSTRLTNLTKQRAQCPNSSHGFKHDKKLRDMPDSYNFLHNWMVGAHGLCYPQYVEIAGLSNPDLVPQAGNS